ncbi:hypothetical protein IWX85_001870 [Polaromonas sp. CG_9.11]|nr:hypothetical protein [Polaromonas sp. CG_9.11]
MLVPARASKLDLLSLAEQLKQRNDELMAQEDRKAVTPLAEPAMAH